MGLSAVRAVGLMEQDVEKGPVMEAPYQHIACCLDGSPASARALEEARRLHALGEGRLTLVHAVDYPVPVLGGWVPDAVDLVQEEAHRWLEEAVAGVRGAELALLEGHPAGVVCDWAAANRVDLLVCAAHRNVAARIALGSFAHYLLNHSPAPVLVTRPPNR